MAALLREAADEVLASLAFPLAPWRQVHATNVLARLNRELARRCDVVGIFPNGQAVLPLLGALLEERQDEWEVQRRYLSEASMSKLRESPYPAALTALRAAGEA